MHPASAPAPELYWAEFDVTEQDIEFIDNLLLEREVPLTIEAMAYALAEHRLELQRIEQESRSTGDLDAYRGVNPGGLHIDARLDRHQPGVVETGHLHTRIEFRLQLLLHQFLQYKLGHHIFLLAI